MKHIGCLKVAVQDLRMKLLSALSRKVQPSRCKKEYCWSRMLNSKEHSAGVAHASWCCSLKRNKADEGSAQMPCTSMCSGMW